MYFKSPKITLASTKFQTTKLYVSTATTTKLSTATTSTFTTNLITTKPTTLLTLNLTAAPSTVTNCRSIVYQYTPNITSLKNTTTTCRTFCWAAVSKMFLSNKNIKIIHIFSSFFKHVSQSPNYFLQGACAPRNYRCYPYFQITYTDIIRFDCCYTTNCNNFAFFNTNLNYTCQNNVDIGSRQKVIGLMDLTLPSVQQCYYSAGDNVTSGNLVMKNCPTTGHYSCGVLLLFTFIFI